MATYCAEGDLLLGDIPLSPYTDPTKYIQDAADEIDSRIGALYVTPVDIADETIPRPVRLLLKRLNVFLASGRLLMAIAAPGEDAQLHAYAKRLVDEALMTLQAIASGQFDLEGVERQPSNSRSFQGPLIANKDQESNVDAFYDRIANPDFIFAGPSGRSEVERGFGWSG